MPSAVSLGRRKVSLDQPTRWVFNRMAEFYAARPPYPVALVDALADLAGPAGSRVGDLGAGIGHLALPLAARGFDVVAIDAAQEMLDRLRATAAERGIGLRALHAAAEELPLEPACLDLVVVADALHFLDTELTAGQIARVLAPRGALALVTCAFAETPFMRGLVRLMEEAAPRRPRALTQSIVHLSALTGVSLTNERRFHDETPIDHATLERILRSISFIGPAMHPARFAAFRRRVHALPDAPVWARTFVLRSGRRAAARQPRLRAARLPPIKP
jgi:ubiquinone/menaquinone biosynthesis C-methylase UbiE